MRKWKKVLSFVLAMVLVLGSAIPAVNVKANEKESAEAVYLDELDWDWAYASTNGVMYGDKGQVPANAKQPQKAKCFWWERFPAYTQLTMSMSGTLNDSVKTFEHGIGTDACSEIVYKIGKEYDIFESTIGFDNFVLGNAKFPSSVQFKVFGSKTTDESANYEELYASDIAYARPYFVPEEISVNIRGYEYLKLWVWDAGKGQEGAANTHESDTVDWADARLIKAAPLTFEELQKLIASAEALKKEEYTEESWKASGVEKALEDAKKLTDTNTVEEWTAAFDALQNAMDKLVKLPPKEAPRMSQFSVKLSETQRMTGDGIVHGEDIYVTVEEGTDVTALAAEFAADQEAEITVNGAAQVSGETKNDFTDAVTYTVSNANGSRNYTVHVGTWEAIPGFESDGDITGVAERPYINDYSETLTMKLFLAAPDGKGGSKVRIRFDEALDMIKEIDAITRGIPKIIYLVGWQFEGHDDKYPSWDVVNKNLVCADCDHETPLDCLFWMMDESYEKYHTKVSLHINSSDAYEDSPLWDEYTANDLVSKDKDGNYLKGGLWNGEQAYWINYKNEWSKGFYKKRVDGLLDMFEGRLERAGSIHSDAFLCFGNAGSTYAEEQDYRRREMRYWRDCGVDLTTEFLFGSNGAKDTLAGGHGTGLVGLMPMAWHFNQSQDDYMKRPAALATGGNIDSALEYGSEWKNFELLFGRTTWGETIFTQNGIVGPTPGWDQMFTDEFCISTLTWAYLNQFERLKLTGSGSSREVIYSDGVVSSLTDKTIQQNGKAVRIADDLFMPAAWQEREIIAYSKDGYTDKTWQLPDDWSDVKSVDLFTVSKEGLRGIAEGVECPNGEIVLSLDAGEMITIVPNGTLDVTVPYNFNLLTPADQATEVKPDYGSFTWEASKNAVKYHVVVAEDEELTVNRQEKTVSDASADFSEFAMDSSKKYYWTVIAESERGETTEANAAPATFVTEVSGVPEMVTGLDIVRYADDHVVLTWDEAELPYTYHVLRRVAGEKEFIEIGKTIDAQFMDANAHREAGQVYEYVIRVFGSDEAYVDSKITLLDHEVYLSDIMESDKQEKNPAYDWGKLHKDDSLNRKGGPIRMGGITFEKGIETHADSWVSYALDGNYQTFRARIGTDDMADSPVSLKIQIWGDDELLVDTREFNANDRCEDLILDVANVNTLTLKVLNSSEDGNNTGDWGAFGAARLAPKVKVDKTALADLIDYAQSQQNTEDYKYLVPVVKEAFEKALAEAVAVNDNADATQEEVDAAHDALLEMVGYLDFTGNSESLKTLVEAAKVLNEKLYTEESWGALQDALAKAEEVLADENALQKAIDAAKDALQSAMDNLAKNPVDKTKLQKLVDKSKKYEDAIAEYTPATAEIFKGALEHAREVLASDEVTQEEIDAAYTALQNAIFNLRLIPNKDKLEDLIKKAEAVDTTKYTEESVAVFTAALDNARAVFADENATEEDVKAAEKELKKAQKNLVAKADDTDDKDNNGNNGNGSNKDDNKNDDKNNNNDSSDADKTPVTGDSTSVWMTIVLCGAAIAAGVLVMRRKRR